nr:MAG TPA: hypothetical protein [Caudoviricetes sp.]
MNSGAFFTQFNKQDKTKNGCNISSAERSCLFYICRRAFNAKSSWYRRLNRPLQRRHRI